MDHGTLRSLGLAASMAAAGCGGNGESPSDYADFELLDPSVCDVGAGGFTPEVDNPFFPLPAGGTAVLEGEDGSTLIQVVITVLDEPEVVAGVSTRVVEERESEDGELVEVSRNFFTQAPDGTVCYLGEDVDDYEDGEVVGHEGQWRAGQDENAPGIIMPGDPRVGVRFQQERAPGVAEDWSAITDAGEEITVPAGTYTDTLRAFDWNELEPGEGGDEKYYARGVGLIIDEDVELVEVGSASLEL